jgi:3-oxoacyl-[acyl-carrier protein] reductase
MDKALNVVVTGGTRGIGLAIAESLMTAGYHVVVVARTITPAIETLAATGRCSFISWDLSEIGRLGALDRRLVGEFGRIYGLVNNAGIGTSGILSMMADSQIARTLEMNVTSPITLTKYVIRSMMAARAGRVVNIASVVANSGYSGLAAYSASKAALIGFTRSLAREVGSVGITVNAIAPGFVDTEMTHGLTEQHRQQISRRSALHRMATAADIGAAAVFLMSAANITGTTITVDAGNTA